MVTGRQKTNYAFGHFGSSLSTKPSPLPFCGKCRRRSGRDSIPEPGHSCLGHLGLVTQPGLPHRIIAVVGDGAVCLPEILRDRTGEERKQRLREGSQLLLQNMQIVLFSNCSNKSLPRTLTLIIQPLHPPTLVT